MGTLSGKAFAMWAERQQAALETARRVDNMQAARSAAVQSARDLHLDSAYRDEVKRILAHKAPKSGVKPDPT